MPQRQEPSASEGQPMRVEAVVRSLAIPGYGVIHALLVRGANKTQIMDALGVSIQTAKQHKSEVLGKFQVSNLADRIDTTNPEIR